jgi:hypothetical protein
MLLDCKTMTGVIHNCPNLSECLRNSRLNRIQALVLYFLNQGIKPSDIKVDGQPLQVGQILNQLSDLDRTNFVYSRDYQTRDTIIFGTSLEWSEVFGGAKNFYNLSIDQLQQLVDSGFASPIEKHNESPAIIEFLTFARIQLFKGFIFTFEGYVVSPFREDYRVSIDGIVFNGTCEPELVADFQAFVGCPDELDIKPNYLRAWWD